MSSHNLIRCPLCGFDSARDITSDFRIRMAKEHPHDQTQDFDVKIYRCNKCGREFESTEVKKTENNLKKE
jgi:predicted Zn-ribbon and HTH transcriptional regulator